METRLVEARLDRNEALISQIQINLEEMPSSMAKERLEEREFRKFMMAWVKEQDPQFFLDFFDSEEGKHPGSDLSGEKDYGIGMVSDDIFVPGTQQTDFDSDMVESGEIFYSNTEGGIVLDSSDESSHIIESGGETPIPSIELEDLNRSLTFMLQQLNLKNHLTMDYLVSHVFSGAHKVLDEYLEPNLVRKLLLSISYVVWGRKPLKPPDYIYIFVSEEEYIGGFASISRCLVKFKKSEKEMGNPLEEDLDNCGYHVNSNTIFEAAEDEVRFVFTNQIRGKAYAELGQNCLMDVYDTSFSQLNVIFSQLPKTDNDFKKAYFRVQLCQTVASWFDIESIPIFNENNAISTRVHYKDSFGIFRDDSSMGGRGMDAKVKMSAADYARVVSQHLQALTTACDVGYDKALAVSLAFNVDLAACDARYDKALAVSLAFNPIKIRALAESGGTSLGAPKGWFLCSGSILEKFCAVHAYSFDYTVTVTIGRPIVTNIVTTTSVEYTDLQLIFKESWSEIVVLNLAAIAEINIIHPTGEVISEAMFYVKG